MKAGGQEHARKYRFYKMAEYGKRPREGGEIVSGYRYMTLADRQKLEALYLKGERVQDIADQINRRTEFQVLSMDYQMY